MASSKSASSLIILLVLLAAAFGDVARAQTAGSCTAVLNELNICAPFVVPGPNANPNPSAECCGALQAVPTDCLCNTLRIAARLPTQCNLPQLSCAN